MTGPRLIQRPVSVLLPSRVRYRLGPGRQGPPTGLDAVFGDGAASLECAVGTSAGEAGAWWSWANRSAKHEDESQEDVERDHPIGPSRRPTSHAAAGRVAAPAGRSAIKRMTVLGATTVAVSDGRDESSDVNRAAAS
jgi:hypothetical protein